MDQSPSPGAGRSSGAKVSLPSLAHDEASALGSLRPVRARITGSGSGVDPELVQRLTRQALEVANNGAEELSSSRTRAEEPDE